MNTRTKTNWRPKLETLEARQLLSIYADFNGDGFDDMAIGVPGEDNNAGAVQVIYGSASGLTATGNQIWSQSLLGTDASEPGDGFGTVLAGGDFNNDGFADLAVGVPNEDIGAVVDAGMVHFIVGSAAGLSSANDYIIHQNINRVRDIAEAGDVFGSALAAGDFNNDGFTDLAVGLDGQDLPGKPDAGGIHVFYGGGQGIKPPGNQTFNLDSPTVIGVAAHGDQFGHTMTSGDFNGDGRDDLAVGAQLGDAGAVANAGTVNVFYASTNGIGLTGNQQWSQDSPSIGGIAEAADQFGSGLGAGDFNNDGFSDLAIGALTDDVVFADDSGALHVIYGSAGGLTAAGSQFITQNSIGGAVAESEDFWGFAVATGDFDFDNFTDIAVGGHGQDIGPNGNAGMVIVLYGDSSGLTTAGAVIVTQETVGAQSESGDLFGQFVATGDFDGDDRLDLAVSAPGENTVTVNDAGFVYTLYGGPTFSGAETWSQNTTGILDACEIDDRFGAGVSSSGGKSAPGGGYGRQDISQLITADYEVDSILTKTNKRRLFGHRR